MGDRKLYSDSTFLYHVKQTLGARGHDVIKKRMHKDGHLVDELQQYVRTRNLKGKGSFAIYQTDYAIRNTYPSYNAGKVVTLGLIRELDKA